MESDSIFLMMTVDQLVQLAGECGVGDARDSQKEWIPL